MEETLKKLFSGTDNQALIKDISAVSDLMDYPEGTEIIKPGEYIKQVPIVVSGLIKVLRENENGNELFLYSILPGESCAMSFSCCSKLHKSNIRAIAEENTTIISVPSRHMEDWSNKYPLWRDFVISTFIKRYDQLIDTIDQIAFRKMDERLLNFINKKTELSNSKEILITHQQIAIELNTSREVISRLLKKLENDEIIKLGRNKITIL